MAIAYNKKINRKTDWGGDASTNYLPVAGNRVQELIKTELIGKIGAFYKPAGGNYIYCFATAEDKDNYILTGDERLIVDRIETESNYNVYVNQETLELSKSIIDGTTGNNITFQFKIIDKNGMVGDSKATIEYSFLSGGNVKRYTSQVQVKSEGWTTVTSDVIDDYLKTGENTITIFIQGLSTKASSQFIVTYNVFNLKFETNFEYNRAKNGNSIEIPYSVSCSEIPINLEYYLDGISVNAIGENSMIINDYSKDGMSSVAINGLNAGKHTLQARAFVYAKDGSRFYSKTHYYSFCIEGNVEPSLLLKKELDNTNEIIGSGEDLTINMTQFDEFSINWSMYDYSDRKFVVNFVYDGKSVSTPVFDTNGKISEFTFKPLTYGNGKILRIFAVDDEENLIFEDQIIFNIKESPSGIKETTDRLLLKLSAIGRRNSDENHDVWECLGSDNNIYNATFHNFAWNKQQGWNEDEEALVISDDAYVEFNIRPMVKSWQLYGGTFEIDLETFDIEDDDAVICECRTSEVASGAYFTITSTKAEFSTADGVKINTRYKDNEKLKIAFIGNPIGNTEDGNLIYIVVNGVLERAQLYTENDRIISNAYLRIGTGNGGCKIRLRSIRVYDRAITVEEEFNNYVVDSPNSQIIYEKNNVIKKGTSNEIGFDEVANKLPVMIFTGNMNELVTAGQDKNWRIFDVEFVNRQQPELNFTAFNCQLKLQGTSSLGYPRKNFKLKTKNKEFSESNDFYRDLYEVDLSNSTTEGNRRLVNKRTGQYMDFGDLSTGCLMYDYQGQPLKKGKYRFKTGSHKATKWTLKADFMESSCSHNVGAGRSWNDIFENTSFEPGQFAGYNNNTYKDSALVNKNEYETYERDSLTYRIPRNTDAINAQKKYVCRTDAQKICHAENADDIRTAIDGFPMVCFYRTSHETNELVFMGQYNFINDKGSFEVFGFEDIEDPTDEEENTMIYDASKVECWEGLKNANPISLFKTIDNWESNELGWKSTYESRYPDPEDVIIDPTSLFELSKWLVSTRHSENDTVYGDTITIDATFAKKINDYQYGYSDDNKSGYTYLDGNETIVTVQDTPANRQKKFEVEKWEHFDVWKVAGYYIYLMRYGAVDQFVKNTMLFTDGNGLYDERTDKKYRKWFFLNYDNDCLFGLRNNGQLAFDWKLDRQTKDGSSEIIIDSGDTTTEDNVNEYAMMGHDSTLWNNLEADDEFMRMVRDLDNSMCSQKLTYENMVTEFDTKQTEMWCERIYNANERYKYIQAAKGIGDMSGNPVNNLWMLQGTRRSHRHWWIANHFNLLDAKWLSGKYRQTYMEFKSNCTEGTKIKAKAGTDYYYAWGLQKKIYESNIIKNEGEDIEFIFPTDQSQGDPVYIYAVNKMSELDFSETAQKVYDGSFKFVIGSDDVSNTLKKLIIGNNAVINNSSIDTSSWWKLNNLEYLDITNYKGIISLPWSYTDDNGVEHEEFKNLHELKARGSGLASFTPAEGSRFSNVELPDEIRTIKLNNILFNSFANDFKYTPTTMLRVVELSNNAGVSDTYYYNLIKPWLQKINGSVNPVDLYAEKELRLSDVYWRFGNLNDIWIFENFKKYGSEFVIKGVIDLTQCGALRMSDIDKIKEIFGENCFNSSMSSIYIMTPNSVFIHSEKNSIVAGKTNVFTREIYPDEGILSTEGIAGQYMIDFNFVKKVDNSYVGTTYIDYTDGNQLYAVLTEEELFSIRNSGTTQGIFGNNVKIDNKEAFIVSTTEFQTGFDTNLKVMACFTIGQDSKISVMDFTVKDPTYAVSASIIGDISLYRNHTYAFDVDLRDKDNKTPIGTERIEWIIEMDGTDYDNYIDTIYEENDSLRLVVVTSSNQPDPSAEMTITARVHNANMPEHEYFDAQISALILHETVILTNKTNPVVMEICNANGWSSSPSANALRKQDAESVTNIGTAFANINTQFSFNELKFFNGLTSIPNEAFKNSKIKEITIPKTVTSIGNSTFENCSLLSKINTESQIGDIEEYTLDNINVVNEKCFSNCANLGRLILGESITEIKKFAFGGTNFTNAFVGENKIGDNTIILPRYVEKIDGSAFETTEWSVETTTNKLEAIEIPLTLNLTNNFQLLYGKYYKEFLVEKKQDGTYGSYATDDGVLYNGQFTALVKYPAKKSRTNEYQVYSFSDKPYTVETIYNYAFLFVENLDKVTTARGWSNMGSHCFEYSNVKEVDFYESSLSLIPDYTFRNCTLLERVILPNENTIRSIGVYAFYNCPMLTGMTLTNGITGLSYTIDSDSVRHGHNFENCGLYDISLPDSIIDMGYDIIVGCNNLESIKLPNKIVIVGNSVGVYIHDCINLVKITLPASSYYDNISYNLYDENNVFVGSYQTLLEAENAQEEGWTIEFQGDNITLNTEYDSLVSNAPSLIEFELPEIDNGENDFIYDGCIYLKTNSLHKFPLGKTEVDFHENCIAIDSNAFYKCTKITDIVIPDNITHIGDAAFSECSSLRSLTTSKSVTVIPFEMVRNDRSLETLMLKGNVTEIGRKAFVGCSNLKNIYLFSETAPIMAHVVITSEHPFGNSTSLFGNLYAGFNTRASGENTIHRLYGSTGWDTPAVYSWDDPVTNPNKCGYKFEDIFLSGTISIKIYEDGTQLENEYVYVSSDSGDIDSSGNYGYSTSQLVNGEYIVPINKLYHGENFYVYSDSSLENKICEFKADYFKDKYIFGEPEMYFGSRRRSLLKSGVFSSGEPENVEDNEETITITKNEYESIMSNLKYLNNIINNFIKK